MTTPTTRGFSRRTIVRSAAWTAPAVMIVSAAPAFAGSPPLAPWTITSSSWEGTVAEVRNNSGILQMRFALTVPSGTSIDGATCMLSFAGNVQLSNAITIPADWSTTQAVNTNTTSFTFTYAGSMTTNNSLDFQLNDVAAGDAAGSSEVTFSSSSTEGPTAAFNILPANVDPASSTTAGYITSPHI